MTYSAIALAAQDEHLRRRIAACIAQEDPTDDRHPNRACRRAHLAGVRFAGLGRGVRLRARHER